MRRRDTRKELTPPPAENNLSPLGEKNEMFRQIYHKMGIKPKDYDWLKRR